MAKKLDKDKISRRNLIRLGGLGIASAVLNAACGDDCKTPAGCPDAAGADAVGQDSFGPDTPGLDPDGGRIPDVGPDVGSDVPPDPDVSPDVPALEDLYDAKLGMVIDLHRCTGCGACVIACKSENNIQDGVLWGNRTSETEGEFPNVKYSFYPTLCNQCDEPPCIQVNPDGCLYKGPGGITMIDAATCDESSEVSAQVCPYGRITYNAGETHAFWKNEEALIAGVTSASSKVAEEVGGEVIPNYNPDKEPSPAGSGISNAGGIEKCTLCDHRVLKGALPYCVVACPTKARTFGDLATPYSEVSKLLQEHDSWRDKEELGTEPKVYYIRKYNRDS